MKKKSPADPHRAKLEKELRDALPEIDVEGLLFLLRQAQVLIHNARVDRISHAAAGSEPAPARATDRAPKRAASVQIEVAESGTPIFLTIGAARKVLTQEEMRRLVRICYSPETKSEALRQLFTVLARERKDILADAIIGNPDHPLLEKLFTEIRARYRLPER
jgi:hypothetical protein